MNFFYFMFFNSLNDSFNGKKQIPICLYLIVSIQIVLPIQRLFS